MSKNLIFKNGLLIGACVAGLTLSACASSQGGGRYGGVYDYESGGDCNTGASCGAVVAPPVVDSRYGSAQTVIGGQPVSPGVVYTDCSQFGGMNCGAPQVYTPPVAQYPAPAMPISCPTGTTPSGDGSCMQTGGGYNYNYSSTVTTPSYNAGPVDCPAGTTPNGDGTCMQSGGGYDFTTTTSTHAHSSSSGQMADCPAGTTPNGDGTCMEGTGVEIYGNDNTGYTPPTTYTPPPTYLPIRK